MFRLKIKVFNIDLDLIINIQNNIIPGVADIGYGIVNFDVICRAV